MKLWKELSLALIGIVLSCLAWYTKKVDAKVDTQGAEIMTVRLSAARVDERQNDMKDDIKEIKDGMKTLLRRGR